MFRIGQKVVCVDDSFPADGKIIMLADGQRAISNGKTGGLTKGAVYTVDTIYVGAHHTVLTVREIGLRGRGDLGYRASRFRPVVEKKTDISWAEEILRRESIDTPERVS